MMASQYLFFPQPGIFDDQGGLGRQHPKHLLVRVGKTAITVFVHRFCQVLQRPCKEASDRYDWDNSVPTPFSVEIK